MQRQWKISLFVLCIGLTSATRGDAITLAVSSTAAMAGDTPDICVSMPDNNGLVSGVQMSLHWDPSCLSVDSFGEDEAACAVNRQTNRTTFRTRVADGLLRAIMLDIVDPSPIAADVEELFCCQFRVASAATGRQCRIGISEAITSDATGARLFTVTRGGGVTVSRHANAPSDPSGSELPKLLPEDATEWPVIDGSDDSGIYITGTVTLVSDHGPHKPSGPDDQLAHTTSLGDAELFGATTTSAGADSGGCQLSGASRANLWPLLAGAAVLLGRRRRVGG